MPKIDSRRRYVRSSPILVMCLCGFLTGAFGQCLVRLQNSSSTLVSLSIPGNNVWPPPGGVLYALLTAPVGTADLTRFTPTSVLATNLAVEGRVLGATVTVPGWPLSETRAFAIVGWFASMGTNFNPAWIGQTCQPSVGVSVIGTWQSSVVSVLNPFTALGAGFTISGPLDPMFCPHISQSPVSQSVTQGITVAFTVTASAGYPDPPSSLTYQWYFNGVALVGRTNSMLVLTNIQPAHAGSYAVTVYNPPTRPAAVSSAIATLEVRPRLIIPPTLSTPPQTQTAEVGDTVCLSVQAGGDLPLAYRWVWNTTNTLSTGPAAGLTLTNIQASQFGAYAVVVTNVGGAVTSAPAMLSVIPVVPRRVVPTVVLGAQLDSLLNLEYCASLGITQRWESFPTLHITSVPQFFFDLTSPLPSRRFYRAAQATPISVPPNIGFQMTPALTLAGNPGEMVRADGINKFGPTNAWFTLDTVTLTNTSQLYFDITAPGQQARLYRLVPVP